MIGGKFGCAVWGCGWVASGHIHAYLRHPDCRLVALGSRRRESVLAKQAEFGLDCDVHTDFARLLADERIDVVSLCTPNDQHAPETIAAARAGKHLFIEKPVATNVPDLTAMCAAVRQAGVRTLVGFVLRFNPLVNLQRKLVAEGELGRVFLLNVDYWFGRERLGWMRQKERTGGAFILAGCHSVDAARYILGQDIVEVRGASATVGDHYDYPAVETAQVRFAGGALGVFSCSLEGCSPYTANVHILGENGTLVNDRFFLRRFTGQADYFTLDTGVKKTGDVYGHPFPAMVRHLIDCIRDGRESPHNLADAVNAHLCCIGVRDSAEAGGRRLRLADCALVPDTDGSGGAAEPGSGRTADGAAPA
jgi:predicted dehydrogenase